MNTSSVVRPALLAARQRLTEQRELIRQQHAAGSPGVQVCTRITEVVDSLVIELFATVLADVEPGLRDSIALVAHGGYGRRDLAPFSDADLMILCTGGIDQYVAPLAQRLLRDLFDAGLEPGQSVRTIQEACNLSLADAAVATSLVESRLLAGSERLYSQFQQKFQRHTRSHAAVLLAAIEKARRDERSQYGETPYLLEPNVKRSRGGLRELQLLRWVGYIRYGMADPEELQLLGALSKNDQRVLQHARDFLLQLRNELHFHAGKSYDVLDKTEQLRLAKSYGYAGSAAILPVEEFMQEYFRHTVAVRSIVSDFVDSARSPTMLAQILGRLVSFRADGDYWVGPRHISATAAGMAKLRCDLDEVLRLADLANLHNKRIAHSTWEAIRTGVPALSNEVSEGTAIHFLSLLSQPARLGELLHRLLELGVLEKLIPAFSHARCLLQFNEYHKYTVDEHCILAVQRATEFMHDKGTLGGVYRSIKQKRTLHLALLIHDLGKGFVEDHSEVGARIAGEVAHQLRLPRREAETLKLLVHKHLVMAHLAFRRDTSDEQLIIRFAVEIGSPEVLDMLFILTAADISAVGPGVWNDWKGEVLGELYRRARRHLAADAVVDDVSQRTHRRRLALHARLDGSPDGPWYQHQIDTLPAVYVDSAGLEKIATELEDLHEVRHGEARAIGTYLPDRQIVEFVVSTHEDITPGVFHKLTGALSAHGLEILSAEIYTLGGGLVLDRFYVVDPDYSGQPPPDRLAAVNKSLVDSLQLPQGNNPAFRKTWQPTARRRAGVNRLPVRVLADNNTSETYTILDIFASDRPGLLFTIARTLFELGLSVLRAKIGTYLDQVVDVFYVTDRDGFKIEDERRLQQITGRLMEAINAMSDV